MKARTTVSLAALALAAFGLVACGGDSGAEDAIAEAIEKVATTSDPANCTELETVRFTEQNTSVKGKKSTKACEEEARRGEKAAEDATVSDISVDGDKATADAKFEGGGLDSQGLELALVDEDGWKVDQIEGFSTYDGEALAKGFAASMEKERAEGRGGLDGGSSKCIPEKIAAADKAEAEELFLGGSPKALLALLQSCA